MDNPTGHDFSPYHSGQGFDPQIVDDAARSPQVGVTIAAGDDANDTGVVAHNTTEETATGAVPVDSGLSSN